MSALSIRLPESLHQYAKEYASHEGISVNQLICTGLAGKRSALATEDYLELRAKRGSRKGFDTALARVPDAAPHQRDRK
jgi:HicB family